MRRLVVLVVATLILDLGKGVAGVVLARSILGEGAAGWVEAAAIYAPVAGHCFPIWLAFRGGKGVATAFGVLLAAAWPSALVAGAVFLVLAVPTRWVSVGSLGAAVAAFLAVLGFEGWGPLAWGTLAISLTIVLRHRENIRRLRSGEESKLGSR